MTYLAYFARHRWSQYRHHTISELPPYNTRPALTLILAISRFTYLPRGMEVQFRAILISYTNLAVYCILFSPRHNAPQPLKRFCIFWTEALNGLTGFGTECHLALPVYAQWDILQFLFISQLQLTNSTVYNWLKPCSPHYCFPCVPGAKL